MAALDELMSMNKISVVIYVWIHNQYSSNEFKASMRDQWGKIKINMLATYFKTHSWHIEMGIDILILSIYWWFYFFH